LKNVVKNYCKVRLCARFTSWTGGSTSFRSNTCTKTHFSQQHV